MFYSAKVACTSLRVLYLAIHQQEFSDQQNEQLDGYHNLLEVLPFDPEQDYSGYFKFYISRNPYGRIVSAFLDQYVYAQNSGVQKMLQRTPPKNGKPNTFIEFLEYLKTVPDGDRDTHFQSQTYFKFDKKITTKRRLFSKRDKDEIHLNYVGDMSKFNHHLRSVYRKIFKASPVISKQAQAEINVVKKFNSSFYGDKDHQDAALIELDQLEQIFAPKPQDFFISGKARTLVQEIYAEDFRLFNYDLKLVPHKAVSPEFAAIPDDFDWQTYLLLSPDLVIQGLTSERKVIRHYLEFGRFETESRSYQMVAPEGFSWEEYLALNEDLEKSGIDNERDAIIHYLSYGRNEKRSF